MEFDVSEPHESVFACRGVPLMPRVFFTAHQRKYQPSEPVDVAGSNVREAPKAVFERWVRAATDRRRTICPRGERTLEFGRKYLKI